MSETGDMVPRWKYVENVAEAREQGRREGLEEAAGVCERQAGEWGVFRSAKMSDRAYAALALAKMLGAMAKDTTKSEVKR